MPAITLTPTTANPGTTITVRGTGFKSRQKIKMRIDPPNGTVKSYTCSLLGVFKGTVVTGDASSLGVHKVTVTSATSTIVLASGTFTLVPIQVPQGPQVITGPIISNITQTGCTVTWTLSEKCTGQLQYGTTIIYGQLSTPENSFNYSTHIQSLNSLVADTTYHLRVIGTNTGGLSYTSLDVPFKTLAAVVSLPPAPLNFSVIPGNSFVTLGWS